MSTFESKTRRSLVGFLLLLNETNSISGGTDAGNPAQNQMLVKFGNNERDEYAFALGESLHGSVSLFSARDSSADEEKQRRLG